MENKNKTTFTLTDRDILFLYLGLSEMKLDFISELEEAIDDCYSCGDVEGVEKLQALTDEFFELQDRIRPYVNYDLFLEKGFMNYG